MSPRRPSRTDALKRVETRLLTERLRAVRDADRKAAQERRTEEPR